MPELLVDWPSIEKEYLQGMHRAALVTKFGVTKGALNARIARGNWATKRDKLFERASKNAVAAATRSLTASGAATFVERVQKQVNVGLDVLEQNAPETLGDAEKHSRVLDNYDKIGRRVYGLDGENGGGGNVYQFNLTAEEPPVLEAKVVRSCQVIEALPLDATGLEPASDVEPPA